MAKREVTVVINGEEYVSKAAESADSSLGGFANKVPGYAKVIAGLTIAFQAVQAVIGKVRDVVVESFAAYDDLATSQRKIEGTAKLTGLSMEYLNGIAEQGRKQFGLSRIEANDYATEVAKLAVKSGDASKATDLLAGFLNIGAARGLSAAESLKAAQQAILGIDEGTDKLFGQNPSGLWDDYAKVIGKSAGKFTDTEKSAALAYAVMENGNKVVGSYAEFLNTAQGKQALLNSQLQETKARVGEAMQPLRAFAVDTMMALTDNAAGGVSAVASLSNSLVALLAALRPVVQPIIVVGTVLFETFGVGLEQIILTVRRLSYSVAMGVGSMLQSFGELASKGGRFLKIFGIDAVQEAADSITQFGTEMVQVNQNKLLRVEYDQLQFTTRAENIWKRWRGSTKETVEGGMNDVAAAVTTNTPKVEQAAGALATSVEAKLGKPLAIAVGLTEGAIQRLGVAASAQLPTEQSQKFLTHMEGLVTASHAARDRMLGIGDATTKGADKTKDMAREVEQFARGALDAAGAFGVIDENAQRSLNSAVSIASAVSNMAKNGLSFAGVTGVIGGVASIVSTMMNGDAERKRLLKQNNDALDRLRKDIGGLNLRITGDTLVSAQAALGGVVDKLKGGRGAANENDVRNALYAQGLSMEDFDRIAKEFGIEVRTKSGALNVDSVKAVFEAIKTVQLGKVGGDFQSQLDFFTQGQDINNEQGAGRASNLLQFLQSKGNVGALAGLDFTDPTKLREQLIGIRAQLNSAQGIDETQLGKLSGGQFNDLLVQIIGMLGTSGSGSGGGTVSIPDTGTGTGGGLSAPTETIQAVIKAMDTNIAGILTTHTAIHERIAVATESSAASLVSIDAKMDTLIAVTAGPDKADAMIEEQRYLLKVQQGGGASF